MLLDYETEPSFGDQQSCFAAVLRIGDLVSNRYSAGVD